MYIAIGVLLLCFLLLLAPLRIQISFSYLENTPKYTLRAGLGFLQFNISGLLSRKKKQPALEKQEKEKKDFSFRELETLLSKGVEILSYLRKKFTVHLFSLRVRMGLGDAADTGIATGAGYAAIYNILGTIDRYFVLKKHEVSITPVFQGMGFEAEFRGDFRLRLIYCLGLIYKIRKEDVL